jgi:hypothetical protein
VVVIQHAAAPAGAVVDEQFFRIGLAGEPADRVTGQAELGGGADAGAFGQQGMNGRVTLPGALGYPAGARPGIRTRRRRSLSGPRRHGRWLRPTADGIELFNIAKVPVTRYRYRGSKIPSPWAPVNHA